MNEQGQEFTRNAFLGGRVTADQPVEGFRAGHDTVLLAAAVPARASDTVLELGAGAGIASLCLAARVPGISVLGIEIDAGLAAIANANAALNGAGDRVRFAAADIGALEGGTRFAHVFFNPPFHPETGRGSPVPARERAKRADEGLIGRWTSVAMNHARSTVTAILRSGGVPEMTNAARGYAVTIFPLRPREGQAPKRAIVRIEMGLHGPMRVAEGLALHEADGKATREAEAILRHALPLDLHGTHRT